MKLLMWYVKEFSYTPSVKTLDEYENHTESKTFNDTLLAFIHAEEHDQEDLKSIEKKLVNNIKWGARKNNTKNVVLHSFAHLSESKATPEFTKELFDLAEIRLKNADYLTAQSPFGYFLDLKIEAPGVSQARIFRSF